MLQTKLQGHQFIGSEEEKCFFFFFFFSYLGMAAMLVFLYGPIEQLSIPPIPGVYICNSVTVGPVVSDEKSFDSLDGRRRRTTTDNGAYLS